MAGMSTSRKRFSPSELKKSRMDRKFQISIWFSNLYGTFYPTWWALYASSAILDLGLEAVSTCQTWWKCSSCSSGSEVPFAMLLTWDNKLLTFKYAQEEFKTTLHRMKLAFNQLSAQMTNLLRPVSMLSRSTIRASAGVFKPRMSTRCSTEWTKNLKVFRMSTSQKSNLEKNLRRSKRKKQRWRSKGSLITLFASKKLIWRSKKDNLFVSLEKLALERVLFSTQW